jgi:hypothetical protein
VRINVYSQELTSEVLSISKQSNTGIVYKAVQFVLHSSPMLHHPPADDDRSAVTFWLPQSQRGLEDLRSALRQALDMVEAEYQNLEFINGASKFDRHMMRVSERRLQADGEVK